MDTNSEDFRTCLGLSDEAPNVVRLLTALELRKKVRVPRGETQAFVALPKKGVCLVFEPEGPKTSRLTLIAAQLYSDAEAGFTRYPGTLPGGLDFSDSQAAARAKMGKPTEVNRSLRLDVWERDEYVVVATYTRDLKRIAMITLQRPVGS